MKSSNWLIKAFGIILSVMVIGGCSGKASSNEATLTFDGSSCTYEGPQTVRAGEMKITMNNQSDKDAAIWAVKLNKGKTWQDILDFIGPAGSPVEPPAWTDINFIARTDPNAPGAIIYQVTEGLYAFNCCTCNELNKKDQGVWPGAILEVTGE